MSLPCRVPQLERAPQRRMRPGRAGRAVAAVALTLVGALTGALAGAPTALAHAQLLSSSPAPGASVAREPREVIFEFNQSVGGTLGAVRVYDAAGHEVDDLAVAHPGGNEHWLGVGLQRGLPEGTYTATYRVISADTHIVYGGLVFSIGHPGGAPTYTVAGLISRNQSGEVTTLAFGAVRALDYASIALLIGGLAFLLIAWMPGFAAVAGTEPRWSLAGAAFRAHLGRVLGLAVGLGLLVSILGILLQGASAEGMSLWASLRGTVLLNTLESRFGWVWGLRALDWVALGALLLLARGLQGGGVSPEARAPAPTAPASALPPTSPAASPPLWLATPVGLGAAYLAVTPALAGHASSESPEALFFASDVLHVLAASVWVGGIACLLFVAPAGTRRLEAPERTRLLLGALTRFSPLALACVAVIAVTGVIQAYIDVHSLHALLHTSYGALILAKTALLLALIGLGSVNRQRIIPGLQRIAAAAATPGATGRLARRTLRGELAIMAGVLGVTAALISDAPPVDMAAGPFSIDTTLGPALLEMTVEPARTGSNTIHLYLIDASSGTQYTASKELTITATLPAKGIGPLALKAYLTGPGHYTLNSAELTPAGTWAIKLVDRVSEFESFSRTVEVPIR